MSTLTPNMSLVVPTVGVELGPDWATDLNADLGILDQHNHSNGQGVQITPSGLNINADLNFNQNNLTAVKTVNFHNLSGNLAGTSPNLGCIYVAGGELVYNDEAGNVVPITHSGSVNAGAGSITGLPSGTASASFSAGTFVWQSATNTPANMDNGSVILRNIVANSKGLTLNPPNSMAADYSLTLPSVPAQTNVMTLDNSGNMSSITYDQVGVNMTSTGANAIANTRTRSTGTTVGAGGVAISSSSSTFSTSSGSAVDVTNLTVTITTTGRPVYIGLQPDGTASVSNILITSTSDTVSAVAVLVRGATTIHKSHITSILGGGVIISNNSIPPGSVWTVDAVAAGTYTYKVQTLIDDSSGTVSVAFSNIKLVAYEL